jgi:hypothetical protein
VRSDSGTRPADFGFGSTTGLVYSQKLLLPDYGCAKMWVALKRDQQPAASLLLLRGGALHELSGCSAPGLQLQLSRWHLLRRQGSARRLAPQQHPRRGRPPLRVVQQPLLIGGMAGLAPAALAAPLTVCLCPTKAQASRAPGLTPEDYVHIHM